MNGKPPVSGKSSRTAAWQIVAIIGPPAFVVLTGLLMYGGLMRSHIAAKLVDHSHEVVGVTEKLLAHLTDAETGQRGFVLTGEERYLEPYLIFPSLARARERPQTLPDPESVQAPR